MKKNTVFRYRTPDGADPGDLPRVFFSCHPDDFEMYFEIVCDMLFSAMDCAVYYTEDQNEDLSSVEAGGSLRSMRTFVILLSGSLLIRGGRAMEHDLPFAVNNSITVLPLVMEKDLEEHFRIRDIIGDIPYIDTTSDYDPDYSLNDRIYRYLVDKNDPGILRQYHALAQLFSMKEMYKEAAEYLEWVVENIGAL